MPEVVVIVPVLGRPQRVQPFCDALYEHSPVGAVRALFVADSHDRAELDAIAASGEDVLIHDGNYAAKVNAAVVLTTEPLLFFAADDLRFRAHWLRNAQRRLTDAVQVVGVNDMLRRRRRHATHFLVTRDYAQLPTIDGEPGPLSTAYQHSFVDDEFIATATKRGAYAYAIDAHVEHLHPMGGLAVDDATYRKGRDTFKADRRVFQQRFPLWAT